MISSGETLFKILFGFIAVGLVSLLIFAFITPIILVRRIVLITCCCAIILLLSFMPLSVELVIRIL